MKKEFIELKPMEWGYKTPIEIINGLDGFSDINTKMVFDISCVYNNIYTDEDLYISKEQAMSTLIVDIKNRTAFASIINEAIRNVDRTIPYDSFTEAVEFLKERSKVRNVKYVLMSPNLELIDIKKCLIKDNKAYMDIEAMLRDEVVSVDNVFSKRVGRYIMSTKVWCSFETGVFTTDKSKIDEFGLWVEYDIAM